MIRSLWALMLFSLVPPIVEQPADTPEIGLVTGFTFDSHHVPIRAAKVYLHIDGKKEFFTAETNLSGVYRFAVPGGTYTLRAKSDTRGEAFAGPFTVKPKKVTTVDLVLQPSAAAEPQLFDEPQFTVAGVTDNTYRGGHGSDAVLRSAETLAKATASLSNASANEAERSGHPLEAVEEFQHAAELNPSEPNLFDWGTELLVHRAPQPAAEVFTKGVRLFPGSARMLLGLASSWYAAGSYEQAAQCFFSATDLDPEDPNPYVFLGRVRRREVTESVGYEERMARFAALQPGNALANYYYAVSLWNRSGDAESSAKIRALLERAVAIDPHLGPAYLQLGILYAAQEKYGDAVRAYRRAIEVSPDLEEAHYRLAEAYKRTGDGANAGRELAAYQQLSRQSAERTERERRDIQQFVIDLRTEKPASQTK